MSFGPPLRVVTAAYPSQSLPQRGRVVERIHVALSDAFPTEVVTPRVHESDAASETRDGIRVTRFAYRSGNRPPKQARLGWCGVVSYLNGARRCVADRWSSTSGGAVLAHWVVPSGWVGARIARRLGVPLVLYAHGSDLTHFGRRPLVRRITRSVLRAAQVTLCASSELVELATGLARCPIDCRLAPVGFGPEFERPRERKAPGDGCRFLFVGDLVESKGAGRVAEAFESLGDREDVECCVIGEGPLRARLERIKSVTCLGEVDAEEVAAAMRTTDALLLPSEREGTPIVIQEAIAVDLPVIATDVGGIAALFESRAGWTVAPAEGGLASLLLRWMEGGTRRREERVAAMEANERSSLSLGRTVSTVRSVLEEVVS